MQGEEVFLSLIAMVGFALLAFPLVRALAERIRPRADVAELGERVDFTERLLAKQREPRRLAGS